MRIPLRNITLIIFSASLFGCSTNIKLIEITRTKYCNIKFYSERISKKNSSIKRIYAYVSTDNNKSFYSFYPDKIVKTTDTARGLIYTAFYGIIPQDFQSNIFQTLTVIDSIVLKKGDDILKTLRLNNFKTSNGAEVFQIEVNYYHGFSKHKRFRP